VSEAENILTLFIMITYGVQGAPTAHQRNCVAELHELLQGHGLSAAVELIGYRLWAEKRIALLETDHPFHQAWETVLRNGDAFTDILDSDEKLRGNCSSVNVIRHGFDRKTPGDYPIVVSVTMSWDLDPPD
jgi:hypothetical protein